MQTGDALMSGRVTVEVEVETMRSAGRKQH